MIDVIDTPHETLYAALEALEGQAPDVMARRRAAFERFAELGWPTRKHEAWKYTSVAPIEKATFQPAETISAEDRKALAARLEELGVDPVGDCVVFVDGRFDRELSRLPHGSAGYTVRSLAGSYLDALADATDDEEQAFVALNAALAQDALEVHVPARTRVDKPLEVVFVQRSASTAEHPRVLLRLEREAHLVVVQRFVNESEGASLCNAFTSIELDAAADLDHYALVDGRPHAFHVGFLRASVERDARLRSHAFAFGGALVRAESHVAFRAPGAEIDLGGLYVADEGEHVDCRTYVDHAVPHCLSRQLFHGAIGGRGHGIFNGEVLVRQDAQKTEAHQTNRNLLLSDAAKADTKPQLEIFADDVKCSHGATIGQLDADALFYLRSRALDENDARLLLTQAFAAELTERVRPLALQETLAALLETRLRRIRASQEARETSA